MTPMPPRPGGVDRATTVSVLTATGLMFEVAQEGISLSGNRFQADSQAAAIAFANRFSDEILFNCQREMNNPSFTRLHRTKHKGRRCRANLAGRVFSHRAQFGLPGRP